MSIYFHIPFCKQACHYCNFHFSTSLKLKEPLLDAMLKELEMQRNYLGGAELQSVYFGGGTPSLLSARELESFFNKINNLFQLAPGAEVTLEANPDDITPEVLQQWRDHTPINRLSIGIQSFSDADLKWMNRAHNARHARLCLENALKAGFDNLTIDLIYGAPVTTDAQWQENVHIATDYGIPHLSCYSLTVEAGTALAHFVKKGKSQPVDELRAARQMEWLMDAAASAGYEHYEISNFAKPGWYARHNSSYWKGASYLGIGPAAHSYNGSSRQWNVPNNALYIKSMEQGQVPFESETLTPTHRYNEYILTALRTIWGCEWKVISEMGPQYADYFKKQAAPLLSRHLVEETEGVFRLTRQGKMLADHIAVDLFHP